MAGSEHGSGGEVRERGVRGGCREARLSGVQRGGRVSYADHARQREIPAHGRSLGDPRSLERARPARSAWSRLRRVRRPAAIALLVAVVAVGCGYKQEPTGALMPTFPVTVQDAAGRSIEITRQPAKVVVLDPAGASLLRAIGVKLTLLAPDAPVSQTARAAPRPAGAAAGHRRVRTPTPSRARSVRRPTCSPGFQLRLIERGAAQLGLATGHALAGRDLALRLRTQRLTLVRRIQDATVQTVFVDTGFEYSVAAGDLLANLVRVARGKVVGSEPPQPVVGGTPAASRPRRVPDRALQQGDAQGRCESAGPPRTSWPSGAAGS